MTIVHYSDTVDIHRQKLDVAIRKFMIDKFEIKWEFFKKNPVISRSWIYNWIRKWTARTTKAMELAEYIWDHWFYSFK